MTVCLIALGSNLGNSAEILARAIDELDRHADVTVQKQSNWFRTAPVGGPSGQDEFLNGAVRLDTTLTPGELHAVLREVETALGRTRRTRWAARLVDLDLLLYGDLILQTEDLILPHPRMAFRRFVLEPAAEVAGEMQHPLIGWSIQRLLDHLNNTHNYIALTGPAGTGKTAVARRVGESTGCRILLDPARELFTGDTPSESIVVQRRFDGLDGKKWPGYDSSLISDFWVGQSLLYTSRTPNDDSLDKYQALLEDIITPKLLVRLIPPSSEDGMESASNRLWDDAIQQYYQGPLLELDATRADWAFTELTAAIEAMK